jgi:putative ABC transport system permease protein
MQRCWGFLTLVVRTSSDPQTLAATIRREVLAIDKDQPLHNIRTMTELISNSVAQRRLAMTLLSIFAAVALLLAAIGIYGVMAYAVTQRTHEIGIRMSLGAQRLDVLKLIVGHGMFLAICGVTIGLAAAFALTRLLASLMYEVSPKDPLTFALIPLLLGLVALLACYVPARRATRVDPIIALRCQ